MPTQVYLKYALTLLTGFCLTSLMVPVLIPLLKKAGIVDKPEARRLNKTIIPRAGGMAIFLSFHAACAAIFLLPWMPFDGKLDINWWLSVLACSSIIILTGLIDDIKGLSPILKLTGQFLAASIMFSQDIRAGSIFGTSLPLYLDYFVTVFWFLAIINAFNLIDGLDGLATGLAAIAATGLVCLYALTRQPGDVLVLLGLIGSCLAFLRYNFHPARIFLGDSGSMFLGFIFASIALGTGTKISSTASLAVPLLAMGVPVFDTALAIWRRGIRRFLTPESRIMKADMEHLHHRLLKMGLTQKKVALILYSLSSLLIITGLLSTIYHNHSAGFFLIAFSLGTYVTLKHLVQIELYDSGKALLKGLSKPSSSVLAILVLPLIDLFLLSSALLLSVRFTLPSGNFQEVKELWLNSIPLWCMIPFALISISGSYSKTWDKARALDFTALSGSIFFGTSLAWGLSLLVAGNTLTSLCLPVLAYILISSFLLCGIRMLPQALREAMNSPENFSKKSHFSNNKLTARVITESHRYSAQYYPDEEDAISLQDYQ